MKNKDFHNEPFEDSTLEKLEMFREYLREWLPVFIQQRRIDKIQIFDFFAGPGCDLDHKPGSPMIICEESEIALPSYKNIATPIRLYFNELDPNKYSALCKKLSAQKKNLPSHVDIRTDQMNFADAFEKEWQFMEHQNVANLILLDQCGVKQITKSVFQRIVSLPHTDFYSLLPLPH